jgi:uracil-DNA glycosylase family protein
LSYGFIPNQTILNLQPKDIRAKGKPGEHDEAPKVLHSHSHPRAPQRSAKSSAPVPEVLTLENLRRAAKTCKACDLWKLGTQTVFGEGPSKARVMFVGEQPGDYEDRVGHPFVGPAGRLLDEVLVDVGIDRSEVYVTNIVKHFKWEAAQRGKRRIHKKTRHSEIEACRPWLDAELQVVKPEVLVCLGASAAQALLGKEFRVTRDRGTLRSSDLAPYVMATTHPASILRAPDHIARERARAEFTRDLKKISDLLATRLLKAS